MVMKIRPVLEKWKMSVGNLGQQEYDHGDVANLKANMSARDYWGNGAWVLEAVSWQKQKAQCILCQF